MRGKRNFRQFAQRPASTLQASAVEALMGNEREEETSAWWSSLIDERLLMVMSMIRLFSWLSTGYRSLTNCAYKHCINVLLPHNHDDHVCNLIFSSWHVQSSSRYIDIFITIILDIRKGVCLGWYPNPYLIDSLYFQFISKRQTSFHMDYLLSSRESRQRTNIATIRPWRICTMVAM